MGCTGQKGLLSTRLLWDVEGYYGMYRTEGLTEHTGAEVCTLDKCISSSLYFQHVVLDIHFVSIQLTLSAPYTSGCPTIYKAIGLTRAQLIL